MAKGKRKRWIKPRHRLVRNIAAVLLRPVSRFKYGARVTPFKEQGKRQYLILFNHQTAFDQFFVGLAFKGAVYYLASEDIFSKGWISSLIRYLVAPIPIKKQASDSRAVINCIKVAKEGGTIAMAPEGNRTYSGKTEYINPAVAGLARALKLPIALFRIEGGYGVQPRWSDVIRKGRMRAYVSRIIEPEEYAVLSEAELYTLICEGLYVSEDTAEGEYRHKHSAQYLERALYYCPDCGLSTFESEGDTVKCLKCGQKVRYLPSTELEGVGFEFKHRFMTQWYDAQSAFMNSLDTRSYTDTPLFTDTADLSEVIPYKKKRLIAEGVTISLFGDRIELSNSEVFYFDSLSAVTVLGRNKVNIYRDKQIFQLKGSVRFNALKYVHTFYRFTNISKGDADAKFLGL